MAASDIYIQIALEANRLGVEAEAEEPRDFAKLDGLVVEAKASGDPAPVPA